MGSGATAVLDRLSTASIAGLSFGQVVYCQWLNDRGRMEADVTISKLPPSVPGGEAWEEPRYMVVATDSAHRHVESLLRRGIRHYGEGGVQLLDITGGTAQLNVQGPLAREVLQPLVEDCDLSHEAFPFRSLRTVTIGTTTLLMSRLTYVGELGYELFVPAEQTLPLYRHLAEQSDLMPVGLKALGSLRLEKGYRDYGHDMDNTDTLLEVGLGFTAAWDKAGGFVGREALLSAKAASSIPPQRLLSIQCNDPEVMMYHGEVVRRNDQVVGYLRVASYGHTLGGAVGLAMIKPVEAGEIMKKSWIEAGEWTVEVNGVIYPATASLSPLYDPKNTRILC